MCLWNHVKVVLLARDKIEHGSGSDGSDSTR